MSSSRTYSTVSPYLIVEDVRRLIAFTETCFDAEEIDCRTHSNGALVASVQIGNSVIMMAEGPAAASGRARLHVYVPDVTDAFRRAVDAGATPVAEPASVEEGGRRAGIRAFGIEWWLSTDPNAIEGQ